MHPTDAKPRVYVDGRTVELPPSAMGVPADLDALSGLLSPAGSERARQEPSLPAPPLTGDVPIGVLLDERFGPEVTDRLLEPLLGGVYAGQPGGSRSEAVNAALFASGPRRRFPQRARRPARRPGDGPVFGGLDRRDRHPGRDARPQPGRAGGSAADDRPPSGSWPRPRTVGYRLTVGPTRNP